MRKTLVVSFFLLFCIFNLSAQDSEGQTASFPQFVLYSEYDLFLSQFKLADGTLLKYKELKEKIGIIPENEKLLRNAAGWKVAAWINLAALVGLAAGSIVYAVNRDAPNADGMISAFGSFALISFLCEDLIDSQIQRNINHAINNYNLSIMGIPIK
jgi:hypothetical protein